MSRFFWASDWVWVRAGISNSTWYVMNCFFFHPLLPCFVLKFYTDVKVFYSPESLLFWRMNSQKKKTLDTENCDSKILISQTHVFIRNIDDLFVTNPLFQKYAISDFFLSEVMEYYRDGDVDQQKKKKSLSL